jgi:hypothetical protein
MVIAIRARYAISDTDDQYKSMLESCSIVINIKIIRINEELAQLNHSSLKNQSQELLGTEMVLSNKAV